MASSSGIRLLGSDLTLLCQFHNSKSVLDVDYGGKSFSENIGTITWYGTLDKSIGLDP